MYYNLFVEDLFLCALIFVQIIIKNVIHHNALKKNNFQQKI